METNQVKVRYLGVNKEYTFNTNGFNLNVGDYVVVDTVHGPELAKVSGFDNEQKEIEDLKSVIRIATEKDFAKHKENEEKQKQLKQQTKKIVEKYDLDMKVVSCELNLDATKVIINFTSENRVDFRELVKELANVFKLRIELRQIGPRDEAKIVGGLGPCGQVVCCKRFLDNCEHASIKMAKNQNCSLNPTKISGLCGKLMCCLSYENEHYVETLKIMPKVNSTVKTPDGEGVVIYNNLLKRTVQVRFGGKDEISDIREYSLEDIKQQ